MISEMRAAHIKRYDRVARQGVTELGLTLKRSEVVLEILR
jgi:hypothetical protein